MNVPTNCKWDIDIVFKSTETWRRYETLSLYPTDLR